MEFERTEREFSAAEVAKYFGVPESTQRDWRRRQLGDGFFRPAEKGKKFYFTLSEACALSLAKIQVDAGKTIADALWVSSMCCGAAILNIELAQMSVGVDGVEFDLQERRNFILGVNDLEPDEPHSRYLFFPTKSDLHAQLFPELEVEKGPTAYHFHSLADMQEKVVNDWVHGQIFDLSAFAFSLVAKMSGKKIVNYKLIGRDE